MYFIDVLRQTIVNLLSHYDVLSLQARITCQMWPTEAFSMACKIPNLVYFASFFDKNTL